MAPHPGWQSAKRLFDEARALAPEKREAFLVRECIDQPAVLAEVRSLLEWDQHATGFLETPEARVADLSTWLAGPSLVGCALGPWRIVGVIGHGGMGTVYRAERADEAFAKVAAIKVVRAGLPSANLIERFRRERETLAALDHPSIARLIDGGSTPHGEPYFVMELVDGVPVDGYCDEHLLTVSQRLDLFLAICSGVQYAHENLVIHRDIKPDNILVARDGRPKLLDFGVSKLLTSVTSTETDEAVAATWLLTPDYASPEQVAGRAISTASDVYSLGVLLHVLLTGTRPYHLRGSTLSAIQAELDAATWARPSDHARTGPDARERATARQTTPAGLAARLRGDLDAIVERALGRTLSARYSTVQQLVSDIEAFRARRPVSARGQDAWYVARTFLRRHVVGSALVSALVVGTIIGTGAVLYQAREAADARARAERRFNDVRRLARTFMFDVNDAIGNVPGSTAARALIVRNAIDYLESLAQEVEGDRGLQLELANAFVRVGDAQGNASGPNLGDISGARASYGRAIAIADTGRGSSAPDPDVSRVLALAHRRLGDVLAVAGDLPSALQHAETSESLYREVAALADATVDDRLQAGIGQVKLGDVLGNPNLPNLGRAADASARYQTALAAFRQLDHDVPAHPRVRRYLGLTLERIGTMHEYASRWPDAATAYRDSFTIREALARVEPVPAEARRDFAIASEKLGNIDRISGHLEPASANYRTALAQFEKLSAADPADANAQRTVAISQEKLAGVERALRRFPEASSLLTQALTTHQALASRDTANIQAQCDAARVAEDLGDLLATSQASAPSPSACVRWRQSLTVRATLMATGRATCATQRDADRLAGKLKSCR